MKQIATFTMILEALAACAAPQASMPNPASLYCRQHGNKLESRTAVNGSQSRVCVFPDGSPCDEWAFYRGECGSAAPESPPTDMTGEATLDAGGGGPGGSGGTGGDGSGGYMPPGATEAIADWWGVIKSTEPGAQHDGYFERRDLGQTITFGIDTSGPAARSQIEAMRDSGKIIHLYGTLVSNVPDCNGSQILAERIEVED